MNYLVIPHLGLGDMIHMNGAIRWLVQTHEHVYILCKRRNIRVVSDMYQDISDKVVIIPIKDDDSNIHPFLRLKPGDRINGNVISRIYKLGCWGGYGDFSEFPDCFYDQAGIERKVRHVCFAIPFIKQLESPDQPYIFAHTTSSSHTVNGIINWDIDNKLTINPNTNLYNKGHKWYEIAESFVDKHLLSYCDIIKNADEVHLTNSSFQCLACYLTKSMKAMIRKCYTRETGEIDKRFTDQLYAPFPPPFQI